MIVVEFNGELIKLDYLEIEDLLINLNQCESEGYLNYADPCFCFYEKLSEIKKSMEPNE